MSNELEPCRGIGAETDNEEHMYLLGLKVGVLIMFLGELDAEVRTLVATRLGARLCSWSPPALHSNSHRTCTC